LRLLNSVKVVAEPVVEKVKAAEEVALDTTEESKE
jgi:hypothetical protein